jgi:hypothetical protein
MCGEVGVWRFRNRSRRRRRRRPRKAVQVSAKLIDLDGVATPRLEGSRF